MRRSTNTGPPRWALSFFRWFCHRDYQEDIEGDLLERFDRKLAKDGLVKARRAFSVDVIRLLRPSLFKVRPFLQLSNYKSMLNSYFKISCRILFKDTLYSSVKIGGLAVGIAASILILLYVQDEFNYDQYHPELNQAYRTIRVLNTPKETLRSASFPAPFASTLREEYPDIEAAGRIVGSELFGAGSKQVRRFNDTENNYEKGFAYADQEVLDVLLPNFINGDRSRALDQPHSIIISKSRADKLFPDEDPIDQILILDNNDSVPYRIRGVFDDVFQKSHLPFEFYISLEGVEFGLGEQANWNQYNYYTYIRLRDGSNIGDLETNISESIITNYFLPAMRMAGQKQVDDLGQHMSLQLQPIKDIHLYSSGIQDRLNHGDIRIVWLMIAIAGFILVIACINFVNLSTAKSAKRAKEVGLRKVIGSARIELIYQFLTESVLFSLISFCLGLLIALLLLPYFNELTSKSLIISGSEWWYIPLLGLFAINIGLIAGTYPAFYLSKFKPIEVLKGAGKGGRKSILRDSLVVFQFITSIILIFCTIILYQQVQFILHKDVGFNKDQVILIKGGNILGQQWPSFKGELLGIVGVEQVSTSDFLPLEGAKRNSNTFWRIGRVEYEMPVASQIWSVDESYIKTLGMDILTGRDFDNKMASDSQAIIINQRMAQELGLDSPLGEQITNGDKVWHIIGVVTDFNYQNVKLPIEPVCLVMGGSPSIISIKAHTENIQLLTESITTLWKKFVPSQAIRVSYLDESYEHMYEDIQRMILIFSCFSILSIFIAALGLFALSAFMVEQRRKEMSVRLILGASLMQVFHTLTKNYLFLTIISILIGAPIGWLLMHQWLQDYIYRIDIGWEVVVISGLIIIFVTMLTVSYQSVKVSLVNPVKNLRSE